MLIKMWCIFWSGIFIGMQHSENEKADCPKTARFNIGRSTRIRTLDPLVPNQVRYRAALHSEEQNHTREHHFGQYV